MRSQAGPSWSAGNRRWPSVDMQAMILNGWWIGCEHASTYGRAPQTRRADAWSSHSALTVQRGSQDRTACVTVSWTWVSSSKIAAGARQDGADDPDGQTWHRERLPAVPVRQWLACGSHPPPQTATLDAARRPRRGVRGPGRSRAAGGLRGNRAHRPADQHAHRRAHRRLRRRTRAGMDRRAERAGRTPSAASAHPRRLPLPRRYPTARTGGAARAGFRLVHQAGAEPAGHVRRQPPRLAEPDLEQIRHAFGLDAVETYRYRPRGGTCRSSRPCTTGAFRSAGQH